MKSIAVNVLTTLETTRQNTPWNDWANLRGTLVPSTEREQLADVWFNTTAKFSGLTDCGATELVMWYSSIASSFVGSLLVGVSQTVSSDRVLNLKVLVEGVPDDRFADDRFDAGMTPLAF